MTETSYAKGLEGVIAGESNICKVDGLNGRLYYCGYSVTDVVNNATFEETTFLLLYGHLPTVSELDEFSKRMRTARSLSPELINMVKCFPRDSHCMEILQSSINLISGFAPIKKEHQTTTCNCRETVYHVAQMPGIVAAFHRFRNGLDYIEPRMDLSHGANFLWMLNGEEPSEEEGRIMDQCLSIHAEHSFNASTFTARVVASTLADCYCSISAAIGSLYGSLHGGANEWVMKMVDEIESVENVEPWLNKAFAEKKKVMGMGHRVYKAKDPRGIIMEDILERLSRKNGDTRDMEILKKVEKLFRERMEEKGKPIYPNLDFFSGAVYRRLGIESSLFTPIFAIARVSGWLAHILEQRSDNRLFRPKVLYTGEIDRPWSMIQSRK